MRVGTWHQCGHNSQKMIIDLIDNGIGSGVIVSSRDVPRHKAIEYSSIYRSKSCEVIIDLQFCKPDFSNAKIQTYETFDFRQSIARLNAISDAELENLKSAIQNINTEVRTTAILAPAVKYEVGRPDICDLNQKLFDASKNVGDSLSIPTYATVIIGNSATSSMDTINSILSEATSLDCDGWYLGFEFDTQERVPSSVREVYNCCSTQLKLASTGKPVLFAYAGPLGLLSYGVGVTGVGLGHWQNLWQFTRDRFDESDLGGGGGDAPARYFSRAMWGTIVYPDEVSLLNAEMRNIVHTQSPFSPLNFQTIQLWEKWASYKHLLYVIGDTLDQVRMGETPRARLENAKNVLQTAIQTHNRIPFDLKDNTDSYQANWITVIDRLLRDNSSDYDFLELMSS